jgi:hypothetical protein
MAPTTPPGAPGAQSTGTASNANNENAASVQPAAPLPSSSSSVNHHLAQVSQAPAVQHHHPLSGPLGGIRPVFLSPVSRVSHNNLSLTVPSLVGACGLGPPGPCKV